MSKGKWFDELSPSTPLNDAARRVISLRLEVIRDHLSLALQKPEKDPEYVHQVRVGTRRAGAAIKVFSDCFPKKPLRQARKRIRDLRRAAGGARDWDVFLINLRRSAAELGEEYRSGLDFLYGFATGQRLRAQQELDAAFPNFPFSFDRFLAETSAAIRKRQETTLGELAAVAVPQAVDDLNEALAGDLQAYDLLHVARLMGKRLRYAMEIFSGCFEPEFRKSLYPQVVQMQGILGDANDAHVAIPRFANLLARLKPMLPRDWRRYAPLLEHQLETQQRALPEHRQRFNEWLARWRQIGGAAAFTRLLRKPASPVETAPPRAFEPEPGPSESQAPAKDQPPANGSTQKSPGKRRDAQVDSTDTAEMSPWSGMIAEFLE